jgi:lantibiotic biosynthesis protein
MSVERTLFPAISNMCEALKAAQHGCDVALFDIISGLSGIGLYLISRDRVEDDGADLLTLVIDTTSDLVLAGPPFKRWFTPVTHTGPGLVEHFPYGNYNCGTAHGISGLLAFHALCRLTGLQHAKLDGAIHESASWLSAHAEPVPTGGAEWPIAVDIDGRSPGTENQPAWCYGTVGVCRSLLLAAQALADDTLRRLALSGMSSVTQRARMNPPIQIPTFCHGLAGLIQISHRIASEGHSSLPEKVGWVEDMISLYEPDSILGYRDTGPGGVRADRPGLLQGMSGILLVMLSLISPCDPEWDRLFGLS